MKLGRSRGKLLDFFCRIRSVTASIPVISITSTCEPRHRNPDGLPAILILRGALWRKTSVTCWIFLSSN